jgi:hypothetical protein
MTRPDNAIAQSGHQLQSNAFRIDPDGSFVWTPRRGRLPPASRARRQSPTAIDPIWYTPLSFRVAVLRR